MKLKNGRSGFAIKSEIKIGGNIDQWGVYACEKQVRDHNPDVPLHEKHCEMHQCLIDNKIEGYQNEYYTPQCKFWIPDTWGRDVSYETCKA